MKTLWIWLVVALLLVAILTITSLNYSRSLGIKKCYVRGKTGSTGAAGAIGPTGLAGTATNTGAAGPTGAVSGGSIIPFASAAPISVATIAPSGVASLAALLGFANSVSNVAVAASTVSLVGNGGPFDFAFDAPRSGTVTAISANFSNVAALILGGGVTASLEVQLYHAAAGSNTFTGLPVTVTLSALTGTLVLGTTAFGLTTGLSQAVVAGDRYLLVATVTTTGTALAVSINGYLSAGLNIV
jgi:BclB C-terminal domain-containing protein